MKSSPSWVACALAAAVFSASVAGSCHRGTTAVSRMTTPDAAALATLEAGNRVRDAIGKPTIDLSTAVPDGAITSSVAARIEGTPGRRTPHAISALAARDNGELWLATDATILHSTDSGQNWTTAGTLRDVRALDFTSAETGWAATTAGLMRSNDAGATWNEMPGLNGAPLSVQFVGDRNGWVATTSALWRTRDGGASWTPVAPPCADRNSPTLYSFIPPVTGFALCPHQPGAGSQPKELFRSEDGGLHWELVAASPYAQAGPAVGSLPLMGYADDLFFLDRTHGWLGEARGGLYVTADGGANWRPVPPFAGEWFLGVVRFTSQDRGYVVNQSGIDQQLFEVSGGAARLALLYPALRPSGSPHSIDRLHWFALGTALDSGAVLVSADGQRTWRQVGSVPGVGINRAADFGDPLRGFVISDAGLFGTVDGGITWTLLMPQREPFSDRIAVLSAVAGTNTIFIERVSGWLERSDDGGRSFQPMSRSDGAAPIQFVSRDRGWRVTDFRLQSSDDGGRTWSLPLPLLHRVIAFQAVDAHRVWAVVNECSRGDCTAPELVATDDGGMAWTRFDLGGLRLASVRALDAEHVLVSDEDGNVLATVDQGSNWSVIWAPD